MFCCHLLTRIIFSVVPYGVGLFILTIPALGSAVGKLSNSGAVDRGSSLVPVIPKTLNEGLATSSLDARH